MASITTSVGALDVQSIVSQLMTIEQQPMTASQSRVSKFNTQLSAVGKISSGLSSLQTAIRSLASGSFLQSYKASSSDSTIASVATSAATVAGSYALNITSLAQPRQLVFDKYADGTAITDPTAAIASAPDSLTFTVGGKATTPISLRDNPGDTVTLNSMRDRINQAGVGVTANIVNNNGNYKLVITSTNSGSDNAFLISAGGVEPADASSPASLGGLTQSTGTASAISESHAAQNAALTINGVSVSAASNHLTDAIAGLTLDLSKTGEASINVVQDSDGITTALQAFVDAYNQVHSAAESARTDSMKGNASVLAIESQMTSILATPVSGANPYNSYAYLAQAGISIQKDGTLKLDKTAFNTALSADPAAVKNLFGNSNNDGFADRFNTVINQLLGPDGIIESSKSSINSRIDYETNYQTGLQSKLDRLKAQYTQQYTNLNAILAKMQSATSSLANLLSSS
ncbi:flagellar hook-associated protein FliD [Pseudogulbenkiania sp. NH8B]|uniref:flagellar filament capping protein FliD n=1 Tax=Pseudogulbenkiania sp. (strain NH8B) TaxID=748280 RepID=UPI000227945F|nr:flagellar filament capping protein FliD [Pseudogulbenkiania sp. NH8B]BAK75325.1 flagellar hook-associated protein FliD [Pseudogulbenkiania sp. NH8B]